MDAAQLLNLFAAGATVAVKIAGPVLLATVLIGLCVSLFQALTQINESTLAFVPKLIVIGLVLWFSLPWIVREMVAFTTQVFAAAAGATR